MQPPRSLLLLLALLLLPGGGLAAWALHPVGYPHIVYYQRETFVSSGADGASVVLDAWIDPRRGTLRSDVRIAQAQAHLYIRDGLQYYFSDASANAGRGEPLAPQQARYYAWLFAALAHDGYRGVGEALLAQRIGPIVSLRFGGRAAIRFASAAPAVTGGASVAWLDAQSLEPLQVGSSVSPDPLSIEHFLRTTRLPPGSLPAGFLDLPRAERPAWDRALDWLRARRGGPR